MVAADCVGLPLAVHAASVSLYNVILVVQTLASRLVGGLPKRPIGDKACDCDGLDGKLSNLGRGDDGPAPP